MPVYAHATFAPATFSVRCESDALLSFEAVLIDRSKWMVEVRPSLFQGGNTVGVVAVLQNPELESNGLQSEPEVIFTLQVRVSSLALGGEIASVNCTTMYLSNIFNEKIQPMGVVTPTPALIFDSYPANDPFRGVVTIAESVPRGLFSFIEQAQLINTAVLSQVPQYFALTHLVVMSTGALVDSGLSTSCESDSLAFQISESCDMIALNGSEFTGAELDTITTQFESFNSSITVRVWYPQTSALQATPPSLYPIQGWLSPNATGQCSQQFQPATLSAMADFSFSPTSAVFTASVLPLIATQLVVSDPGVIALSEDGRSVSALRGGTSFISTTGSFITPPIEITVFGEPVNITSLDVTVFSGINLNIPSPPYPIISSQLASVTIEQQFATVSSAVFYSALAVTSQGSVVAVRPEFGLVVESLNQSIIQVDNDRGGEIILIGRGLGAVVQVTWQSPCTGLPIATGVGSIEVTIPDPISLQATISSPRITFPGDNAVLAGIPTQATLSIMLQYPDGAVRNATADPIAQYSISQGAGLVSLAVSDLVLVIPASELSIGEVVIVATYGSLSVNVSLTVVQYTGVEILPTPHPAYSGSESIRKDVLFQLGSSGQYQQVALELLAVLSDNSSVVFAASSQFPPFFQSQSPAIVITSNIVRASAAGTFEITGQLGTDTATVQVIVSDSPVTVEILLQISSAGIANETFSGFATDTAQLELDVQLSDGTVYLDFVPDLSSLSLVAFASDADAVMVNSSTGLLTLLDNHHTLVTITAASGLLETQLSFACNLEPEIGDIDLGFRSGVPIPPVQVGESVSVPLFVNTGSQSLTGFNLAVVYETSHLAFVALSQVNSWPATLQFSDSPATGLITITSTLQNGSPGISGLTQLATLTFSAHTPGVASIGGLILQMVDSNGDRIGEVPRSFVSGDIDLLVVGNRRRRDAGGNRAARNVACTSQPPCELCPDLRERGDVNGDCVFNALDPGFLLQYHAELLYNFELASGSQLVGSLISQQVEQFDSDNNTAIDPQDVYFLQQVYNGQLHFLTGVSVAPTQGNPTCTLAINATLSSRGNIPPNASTTEVFFDIALPFDVSFSNQQLFDGSLFLLGQPATEVDKGLVLQGGVVQAVSLEPGVFGIELQTNLSQTDIGLTVIQVTSQDSLTTNHARTRAMFSSPDPPFTYPNPLSITIDSFSDTTNVVASNGYNPFTVFDNTLPSVVCLTPPGPPILNQTSYDELVAENASVGTELFRVLSTSQSDFPLLYSIDSGNSNNAFAIDSSTGVFTVRGALDFEVLSSYSLAILVTDSSTLFSSTAMAEVTITDVNDNTPVLAAIDPVTLPENTPLGSLVATAVATDEDSGLNAAIEYSINSSMFAIDDQFGLITLQMPLDFDAQVTYLVAVFASDNGRPALSASTLLNITVQPPDPTILQFDQSVYNVSITENSPEGQSILQLQAAPVESNSTDPLPMAVVYSLDTPSGYPFSLDPDTGELAVNGTIDREQRDFYELQVRALLADTDRAVPALAVVLVSVLDLNDNSPQFDQAEYTAALVEEVASETLALRITAVDQDLAENGTVLYSLSEPSDLFSIDASSGLLTNSQPVDFETVQQVELVIVAMDTSPTPLYSSANVTIFITDINDNPPVVAVNPSTASIAEDSSIGTFVATASATDLDSTAVNGDFIFTFSNPVTGFAINSTSGVIVTSSLIDFEAVSSYQLEVVVEDSQDASLSSNAPLMVSLIDVNDNPPAFSQDTFFLAFSEATAVGVTLFDLQTVTSDGDSPINAASEYLLQSGNAIIMCVPRVD